MVADPATGCDRFGVRHVANIYKTVLQVVFVSDLPVSAWTATTAGQYLGACVFYEMLFGDSVVGNPFVPPGLDLVLTHILDFPSGLSRRECN